MKKLNFKNMLFLRFACLFFAFEFFISASIALAFNIPEKFEYDLTWGGITAGTATLEIANEGNNIKITSTAKSAKFISIFYTVDDTVESTLVQNPSYQFIGAPVNYRLKIREGKHRRDKEVVFQQHINKAVYMDHLKNEKREFDIPSPIFDPISSFYYLRTIPLEIDKSVYITVFDSKKVWNVEVQVLRKESVSLPTGDVETIVIKPLMKSEGIFYRKGEITIWLTDDEKRIPVKLKTKVAVGSVTATLVKGMY